MTDNTPTLLQLNEVKRLARAHAKAVMQLHAAASRVPITTAKLAEVLTRHIDNPETESPLYRKADEAMGTLQAAYEQVAAIFDNLEEDPR